jgi:hypothetical protein
MSDITCFKENNPPPRKPSLDVYWILHNFVRVHFTTQHVPAVALGIIEQGLSLAEIFSYPHAFGIDRNPCPCIQYNHIIGCALLVWVKLKALAAQTSRTVYQLKHGLLDDYLIQPSRIHLLKNGSCVSLIKFRTYLVMKHSLYNPRSTALS